jgi:PPOX class probable F420-dependent enzyme
MESVPPPPEHLDRIRDERIAWLTVTRADGMPVPTPIWFVWRDDAFLIYSQPDAFKVRAIRRNQNVTLNFNTDPTGEHFVVAQCVAEFAPDAPSSRALPDYQDKYRELITLINYTPERLATEFSLPIRLRPLRWRIQ